MRLRSKSILRRRLITSELNVSTLLMISFSIQNVKCSFSKIRINDFAIIICEFFKIHTSRFRRAFRSRLRRMFNISDLKSSSIQSTKFFLNCSHNVSFFKFSRSYEIIVVCTKMFLSTFRIEAFSELKSKR
jgi:Golgi nucleoside diphosphatase